MKLSMLYEDVKKLPWWKKAAAAGTVLGALGGQMAGYKTPRQDYSPIGKVSEIHTPPLPDDIRSRIPEYEQEEIPKQQVARHPQAKPQERPQTSRPQAQPQATSGFPMREFISKLIGYEGKRNRAYDDGRGNITIGIGHYMKNSRPLFKELFGNEVDFDQVLKGKALTDDQVVKLAVHDVKKHLARAKAVFPNLSKYPDYLQASLVDGIYRGQFVPNGETVRAINSGDWATAIKRLENRKDMKREGMGGVKARINDCISAIKKYMEESQRVASR